MLSYSTSYHLQQPIRALATSGYTNPTNYTRIPKPVQSKLNANSGLVRLCHHPLAELWTQGRMAHRQLEDERDALYEESGQNGQPRHRCALFVWGGGSETRTDDELVDTGQTLDSACCSAFFNLRRDGNPLLQAAAANPQTRISTTRNHDYTNPQTSPVPKQRTVKSCPSRHSPSDMLRLQWYWFRFKNFDYRRRCWYWPGWSVAGRV